MNSIYSKADPVLLKLFEQAGNLRKVLCVPLDYAKSSHAVMFCNGMGDVLKKGFHVPNSPEGVEKVIAEVSATCRHRKIKPKHVFFGGEDIPSYAENFISALRKRGFLVTRVNAFDAKQQREKLQASTDLLDLHGIAHCLLRGRARALADFQEIHRQLRLLVRERQFLVQILTAARNRLHTHVDRLFPGFLNYQQSHIKPHGPACCWLLGDRFSAPQIARRNLERLVAGLEKNRLSKPQEIAEHLQDFARSVLPPDPLLVHPSQLSLESLLEVIKALEQSIGTLESAIAELLYQSPAARLTTIPGISLTLAAGLGTEIFMMGKIASVDRICAYAGIVPATYQSGGPEKEAYHHATFWHYNARLKNYLLQAGEHMAMVPGTDACELKERTKEKGQHTLRVLGKNAAGVVRSLLLNERAYLPQKLYQPDSSAEKRGAYFQEYWPKLRAKWGGLVPLQKLFDPAQPLGRWRKVVQESYRISLPLPGSKETEQDKQKDSGAEHDPRTTEETPELF
jgi:transposase